jgi:hypothetical protein
MSVLEESPMRAIFGPHPQVKVIETLVLHPDFEYNLTELAESAEISKATIFELRDKLLHYGIMKPTKKVGRIQLYKFDKSSPVGKLLNSLSYKLADIDIDLLLKGEKIKEAGKKGEIVTA